MKHVILLIGLLLVSSSTVVGQSGHAGQEKNLRGLKGLRLAVMFPRAETLADAERLAILSLVEADATAKFETAGIPLLRFTKEVEDAGSPHFIVYITLEKPNGFVSPLRATVKLLQRVRLARDPSIQADLATWEQFGIGGPTVTVEMIRGLVGTEIDQFIRDYNIANSK